MSGLCRLPMVIAIDLSAAVCGAIGLTSEPALAKKSASEAASVQKQKKRPPQRIAAAGPFHPSCATRAS